MILASLEAQANRSVGKENDFFVKKRRGPLKIRQVKSKKKSRSGGTQMEGGTYAFINPAEI